MLVETAVLETPYTGAIYALESRARKYKILFRKLKDFQGFDD